MRTEVKGTGGSVGDWMSKAPMAVSEDTPEDLDET